MLGLFRKRQPRPAWEAELQQLRTENQQLQAENRRLSAHVSRLEARLVELQTHQEQLQAQGSALQAENARLVQALAAAHKHSGNSSKPPSSDIVKPPKQKRRRRGRRFIGGQKGHPWNEPLHFPPEQIDHSQDCTLTHCLYHPEQELIPDGSLPKILQQAELVTKPVVITEYRAYGYWCPQCHQHHYAPFPEAVQRAGLFGPRLTGLMCYLKGKLHGSYSGLEDFCAAVLGVPVSRGYLAKVLFKGTQAFTGPCQELIGLLPRQPEVNTDETGHKDNGQPYWTWCFRAVNFVVFVIRGSRGSEVLEEILGQDFAGVLGADFWSAYRKYARQCGVVVQFCLAHLVREVKYLCEFPHATVQHYGKGLLAGLTVLFQVLHRRDQLEPATFAKKLAAAQAQVWAAALDPQAHPAAYGSGPRPRLIQNLVLRFEKYGEGYFRFISHPGVDPTNNCVEQAIRFVVQDRHVTQGTRSARGRLVCERLWTAVGTCTLQKRSIFAWMCEAITAHFQGQPAPSLLLNSS